MKSQVNNRNAHLANIRLSLVLARLCKQKWQIYQDCCKDKGISRENRDFAYEPLVERYKVFATSHRAFAKTSLELIENQRGATYLAGYTSPPAVNLSELHFSEWPEYKEIYAKHYDVWR